MDINGYHVGRFPIEVHGLVMTNSFANLNIAHRNSWFTELKDGDFP